MDVQRARNLCRLRKSLLGSELYSGPPWEILLHLFGAQMIGDLTTVDNLSEHLDIAPSVADYWVRRLLHEHYVAFNGKPDNGEDSVIELSHHGARKLFEYFAGVAPFLVAA
jgi:hypothetical protein